MKSSVWLELEKQEENAGSEWSPKYVMWVKILPESHQNMNGLSDQWVFGLRKLM